MFLSNLLTVLKVAKKKLTLDAATEAFQFFSDCNETESVIKEFITLAKSKVRRMLCLFVCCESRQLIILDYFY